MVYLLIIFCFVLLSFYFSHPPYNRKYPCVPLVSASQKAKKVPCGGGSVSGGATFSLKKKSGECIGPPSTRHTRLVSCWILFSSRPRYARVTMACSRSPPAHALGAPRDGPLPKPEAHIASGGWRPMRLFFSSTRSFVIMDGPDPFSSSRRAGHSEARGDGRGADKDLTQ